MLVSDSMSALPTPPPLSAWVRLSHREKYFPPGKPVNVGARFQKDLNHFDIVPLRGSLERWDGKSVVSFFLSLTAHVFTPHFIWAVHVRLGANWGLNYFRSSPLGCKLQCCGFRSGDKVNLRSSAKQSLYKVDILRLYSEVERNPTIAGHSIHIGAVLDEEFREVMRRGALREQQRAL